jgi:hypothetical protein
LTDCQFDTSFEKKKSTKLGNDTVSVLDKNPQKKSEINNEQQPKEQQQQQQQQQEEQ